MTDALVYCDIRDRGSGGRGGCRVTRNISDVISYQNVVYYHNSEEIKRVFVFIVTDKEKVRMGGGRTLKVSVL